MYRWTLPILLCVTVHSAPQDSDITYVKIQPLNVDPQPSREPRTDQLSAQSELHQNATETQATTSKLDLTTAIDPISEIDPSIINKLNRISSNPSDNPNRTYLSNQTENKTSENPYRFVRSDVTNYETTTEVSTEKDVPTIQYEARTKTPLRYLSKLSYFKSTASYGGSDVNLVERGKRRFRSKCRCEKIWNCPKLQITVPRCPNEYFLCCF